MFFFKSAFRNLTSSKYYVVQNYLYGAVIFNTCTSKYYIKTIFMQTFCQSHNLNAIIAFLCYEMIFYSEKVLLYYLMVVK